MSARFMGTSLTPGTVAALGPGAVAAPMHSTVVAAVAGGEDELAAERAAERDAARTEARAKRAAERKVAKRSAKRAATFAEADRVKNERVTPKAMHHLETWREDNKALFLPPVCNKLMYKGQLMIMFVGGPNTRTDYHLDLGSEFFYQMKGNMCLPTIQQGKMKMVHIREGEVFLLPSRVPHSPQREANTFGLVIERVREEDELDGLRWYQDFEHPTKTLWERYFHCGDLGRDLVPVVKEFHASEEAKTKVPGGNVEANPPFEIDSTTAVPEPFALWPWIEERRALLASGASLDLFEGHPDGEFKVQVCGGTGAISQSVVSPYETWLYQLEGEAKVLLGAPATKVKYKSNTLGAGCCCVVPACTSWRVRRLKGTIGLVLYNNPNGNKAAAPPPPPPPEKDPPHPTVTGV